MFAALALGLATALAPPAGSGASKKSDAQRGPWLEIQAGPQLRREDGRKGPLSGPEIRIGLGLGLSDRVSGEAWLSGAVEGTPSGATGDRARLSGGVAGRLRLLQLDGQGKLALWGRVGAGFSRTTAGLGPSGSIAFGGAALLFQPFVQRFALGVELDALFLPRGLGFALLPSLRCAL